MENNSASGQNSNTQDNSPQSLNIPGVNVQRGIAMTGGTERAYRQVLSMFHKDIQTRLQMLRFILFESSMSGNKFPEKHLPSFITQVRATKSASATIGAEGISAEAALLEDAGQTGNLALIMENLGGFIGNLTELAESINTALEFRQGGAESKPAESESEKVNLSGFEPLFIELTEALKSQDVPNIDRVMDALNNKPLDAKTKEILEQISDQVLMTEYEIAVKTIDEYIKKNG